MNQYRFMMGVFTIGLVGCQTMNTKQSSAVLDGESDIRPVVRIVDSGSIVNIGFQSKHFRLIQSESLSLHENLIKIDCPDENSCNLKIDHRGIDKSNFVKVESGVMYSIDLSNSDSKTLYDAMGGDDGSSLRPEVVLLRQLMSKDGQFQVYCSEQQFGAHQTECQLSVVLPKGIAANSGSSGSGPSSRPIYHCRFDRSKGIKIDSNTNTVVMTELLREGYSLTNVKIERFRNPQEPLKFSGSYDGKKYIGTIKQIGFLTPQARMTLDLSINGVPQRVAGELLPCTVE